jgi:hypothetical protein
MQDKVTVTGQNSQILTWEELEGNKAAQELVRRLNERLIPTSLPRTVQQICTSDNNTPQQPTPL